MKKVVTLLLTLACLMTGISIGLNIGRWIYVTPEYEERCDTIWMRDTVRVIAPAVRDSLVVRYVDRTVRLVPDVALECLGIRSSGTAAHQGPAIVVVMNNIPGAAAGKSCSTTAVHHEVICGSDGGVGKQCTADSSIPPDTSMNLSLRIPIEQKHYVGERYEAWVSGWEPCLDSLRLYDSGAIVERERIYLPKKRRRWGCVAGVGVSAQKGAIGPAASITVGYLIWP